MTSLSNVTVIGGVTFGSEYVPPPPPDVPNPPTITSVSTSNNTTLVVNFTAPSSNGNAAITSYTAIGTPGNISNTVYQSGSGNITFDGLYPDSLYTFTVVATNVIGNSLPSNEGNGVTYSPSPPYLNDEILYDTAGTYLFTVPAGVYSLCVVCVGAGSNSVSFANSYSAGAGGGLAWKNDIAVTPGQTFTVQVGGRSYVNNGASFFNNTSTVCGFGGTESPGIYPNIAVGGSFVGDGGGNGGDGLTVITPASFIYGGGGAGGYLGDGASGGTNPLYGTGAGGGGGGLSVTFASTSSGGVGGGGVNVYGLGGDGAGGPPYSYNAYAHMLFSLSGTGWSGSGGERAGMNVSSAPYNPLNENGVGRKYGGGGGGGEAGADGAVRIIWGANRAFPSKNTMPTGEVLYTDPGEYAFVAPNGVHFVNVVTIGGGGNSYSSGNGYASTSGGGGGGLAWRNNIPVVPGQPYYIKVGGPNEDSGFNSNLTFSNSHYYVTTVSANGASNINPPTNYSSNGGVGTYGEFSWYTMGDPSYHRMGPWGFGRGGNAKSVGYVGGGQNFGAGGAGAGGYGPTVGQYSLDTIAVGGGTNYFANGGNPSSNTPYGSFTLATSGLDGAGGGATMGNIIDPLAANAQSTGGGGGGVSVYGSLNNVDPLDGSAGVGNWTAQGGGGGSYLGQSGSSNGSPGLYGAGAGAIVDTSTVTPIVVAGSGGAVRVMWGAGRRFPDIAGPLTSSVPFPPIIENVTTTSSSVTVAFREPDYNGNNTITQYTAYVSTVPIDYYYGLPNFQGNFIVTSNSVYQSGSGNITVSGLTNDTLYSVFITATNSVGESSYSPAKSIATTSTSPVWVNDEATFTSTGTYTWTAPAGVTSVCVVTVGAGGDYANSRAGAGGGLGWKNNIPVTPGANYTVQVGIHGDANGAGTGDSFFIDRTTVCGYVGSNGLGGNTVAPGGTYVGDGGGDGGDAFFSMSGCGGGGAGGYSGKGGNTAANASPGSGGGGGGIQANGVYSGGGGVGIWGKGNDGIHGIAGTYTTSLVSGYGGSGGTGSFRNSNNPTTYDVFNGGMYGGGGGSQYSSNYGANGAVRIIWGAGRSFPSTNTMPSGEALYEGVQGQPMSFAQFVPPPGVHYINVLAIGGGGDGTTSTLMAGGGGGGGTAWVNSLPVTPGQTYYVNVAGNNSNNYNDQFSGADVYSCIVKNNNGGGYNGGAFNNPANEWPVYPRASSGFPYQFYANGAVIGNAGIGGKYVGEGWSPEYGNNISGGGRGGNGQIGGLYYNAGAGGGGAGGYWVDSSDPAYNANYGAKGGTGGTYVTSATAGIGGAGGGGDHGTNTSPTYYVPSYGGGGGGIDVFGIGSNGAAGAANTGNGGDGGSGGQTGSGNIIIPIGGNYGGGAGGSYLGNVGANTTVPGAVGAVRIIWGPTRFYPNSAI